MGGRIPHSSYDRDTLGALIVTKARVGPIGRGVDGSIDQRIRRCGAEIF